MKAAGVIALLTILSAQLAPDELGTREPTPPPAHVVPDGGDEERAALVGKVVRCCTAGACVDRPAVEGCRGIRASGGAQSAAARRFQEEAETPEWFRDAEGPFVTPRGLLAEALRDPKVVEVLIGEIVGEEAYWGENPMGYGIQTRCTIRVNRAYKRDLAPGSLLQVEYYGGVISPTERQAVADLPRCLPFDYGIFALVEKDGVLRPRTLGTLSYLGSDFEWDEHPFTAHLEQLAPVLVEGRER